MTGEELMTWVWGIG